MPMTPILSSKWDGLSPHLIATFYEVERGGADKQSWVRAGKDAADSVVVKAPLTEASLEMTLNWQSPFESAGADRGVPTLSAMLQSGALQPFVNPSGKVSDTIGKFEGRTGITKLNSNQVFSGMPPVKIHVAALLRAWSDPAAEVEAPFEQLMRWALPLKLASGGAILSLLDGVKQVAAGKSLHDAAAQALLPSLAPPKIAMHYQGRPFSPPGI